MRPDFDRPYSEFRDRSFSTPEYETIRFGPMVFSSARYGPLLTNSDLIAKANLSPQEQVAGLAAIEHAGISFRRAAYFDGPKNESAMLLNTARIGAALINNIMAANGWSGVDHVNFTSAFLPTSVNDLTLNFAGLSPKSVSSRSYRLACAGSVAAMIDTWHNPRLRNKRVITLSLEPLSYLFGPENLTLSHIAIPGIFGDDYGAVGAIHQDIDLHRAHIYMENDRSLLKYRALYSLPPHNPQLVPSYYAIDRSAEGIVSFSEGGVMIRIHASDAGGGASISERTGGYFASKSVRHIVEHLLKPLPKGFKIDSVILHPASRLVVEKTQEYLARELPRAGLSLPPVIYDLNEQGRSNSSSADTLITWQHRVGQGLSQNDTMLIYAPGIGATFAGMVISLR